MNKPTEEEIKEWKAAASAVAGLAYQPKLKDNKYELTPDYFFNLGLVIGAFYRLLAIIEHFEE